MANEEAAPAPVSPARPLVTGANAPGSRTRCEEVELVGQHSPLSRPGVDIQGGPRGTRAAPLRRPAFRAVRRAAPAGVDAVLRADLHEDGQARRPAKVVGRFRPTFSAARAPHLVAEGGTGERRADLLRAGTPIMASDPGSAPRPVRGAAAERSGRERRHAAVPGQAAAAGRPRHGARHGPARRDRRSRASSETTAATRASSAATTRAWPPACGYPHSTTRSRVDAGQPPGGHEGRVVVPAAGGRTGTSWRGCRPGRRSRGSRRRMRRCRLRRSPRRSSAGCCPGCRRGPVGHDHAGPSARAGRGVAAGRHVPGGAAGAMADEGEVALTAPPPAGPTAPGRRR